MRDHRRVRSVLGLALAVSAVVALGVPAPAAARRAPTAAERTGIRVAVKSYRDDELGVLAKRWALLNRCGTQVMRISTIDSRWALFFFRPRFPEGSARQQSCLTAGGSPEATFVVHRTGARWKVTGWIYGERSGFCREVAATRIPFKVFADVWGKAFAGMCP